MHSSGSLNSPAFEAFLARLYTDEAARRRLKEDPAGEARRAGLSQEQADALAKLDWPGLGFAARSFARKRASAVREQR